MKYILICLGAVIVAFTCGYIAARMLTKAKTVHMRNTGTVLITIFFGFLMLFIIVLGYFGAYYHAGDKAWESLNGNSTVTVEKINGGYRFDGPSDDKAVIFYSGAKIEPEAYAPLMLKLAEAGFDCFLADMPFNFSLLGINTADMFLSAYDYDDWIMAGHSMGGIAAAQYAKQHADMIDGIIFLASYPSVSIEDSMELCSIYGSKDGCLDVNEYQKNQANWSERSVEYIIEGGNHAQFGDYGIQKGDGIADITDEEQQSITVHVIENYFGRIDVNANLKSGCE